ncbi:hypothetical protein, partial [Yersinia kristensenii]|uniref:hypothetical protein n=1 Tax=Yersinia kristensenii TaxID=28152 RepID=UPI001C60A23B
FPFGIFRHMTIILQASRSGVQADMASFLTIRIRCNVVSAAPILLIVIEPLRIKVIPVTTNTTGQVTSGISGLQVSFGIKSSFLYTALRIEALFPGDPL